MLLFQQMLVLFMIMFIGFVCAKKKIIDQNASKAITFLVVNIANPALILSGSVNREGKIEGTDLLLTVLIALCVYAGLMIVSFLIPFLMKTPREDVGTYRVMMLFSNIGFMGFPVIQALFGNEALLYASIFLFPYNILIYTYGIQAMKKDKTQKMQFHISNIFNVGVIFCILSILVYLTGIEMPVVVKTTVSNLSNLTAPLSMIVIGVSLAQIDLKSLFLDARLLIFCLIKLLIVPIAGLAVIRQFVDNDIIFGICVVMLATPVGSMTAMLAQQYDGDSELASRGVALSTVLSVVTIPIVSNIML